MSKQKYTADKMSGFYAAPFCCSILQEVAQLSDALHPFPFRFYALSYDIPSQHVDEWIDAAHYREMAENILKEVQQKGADYFAKLREKVLLDIQEFEASARQLIQSLPGLSQQELIESYQVFTKEYTAKYAVGAISFLYVENASEELSHLLKKRYKNAAEIIPSLLRTDYQSFMLESEARLLEIAKAAQEVRTALIERYMTDFFYIDGNYVYTGLLTTEMVEKRARELLEHIQAPVEHTVAVELTRKEKSIVELLQISEVIHDQRKRLNLIGSFTMSRFLDQLMQRTDVPKELAVRAFWYEYERLFDSAFLAVLEKRQQLSSVFNNGKVQYFEYNALQSRAVAADVKEFRGMVAARGTKTGPVKIVLSRNDFHKIEVGDILVSEMTRPDFVPVMQKVGAIITEEGGLTSHAAIVARELGKPCVIGTKIATQVLKDGMEVEVDAMQGIIRILN